MAIVNSYVSLPEGIRSPNIYKVGTPVITWFYKFY